MLGLLAAPSDQTASGLSRALMVPPLLIRRRPQMACVHQVELCKALDEGHHTICCLTYLLHPTTTQQLVAMIISTCWGCKLLHKGLQAWCPTQRLSSVDLGHHTPLSILHAPHTHVGTYIMPRVQLHQVLTHVAGTRTCVHTYTCPMCMATNMRMCLVAPCPIEQHPLGC